MVFEWNWRNEKDKCSTKELRVVVPYPVQNHFNPTLYKMSIKINKYKKQLKAFYIYVCIYIWKYSHSWLSPPSTLTWDRKNIVAVWSQQMIGLNWPQPQKVQVIESRNDQSWCEIRFFCAVYTMRTILDTYGVQQPPLFKTRIRNTS